jgi:hypothetical protein
VVIGGAVVAHASPPFDVPSPGGGAAPAGSSSAAPLDSGPAEAPARDGAVYQLGPGPGAQTLPALKQFYEVSGLQALHVSRHTDGHA